MDRSSNPGRPRKYCRRSHRQRAYEARRLAETRRLGPDEVLVGRHAWDALRRALGKLQESSEELVAVTAGSGGDPRYAEALGRLNAAVGELQDSAEAKAAW
jgi:hypothetical protein